MASKTEICNTALSHLGVGEEIANVDTENSEAAGACRRHFNAARDLMLRQFQWPFATKSVALGLVEEEPSDEWGYSYRYPSDCMFFRRILSGVRNDTLQSSVKYKIVRDATASLIYTDQEDAEAEYSFKETDVLRYPVDFTEALSYLLASKIAARLTGGDPFKLRQQMLVEFAREIEKAQCTAFNEEERDEQNESGFIRARD